MTQYVHLVARARRCPVALTDEEVAEWLWERMRDAFPDALSASLMPNHSHLLAPSRDADASRLALSAVLSGLRRSKLRGAVIPWEPVGTEGLIDDPLKVERSVRYLALNPTRAGLVKDPLSWPWSTHRDVMGAIADPWVTSERLAEALDRSPRGFRAQHHGYVSSDPSVRVEGTAPPLRAAVAGIAHVPLGAVLAAACAATRAQPEAIQCRTRTRRIFLQLAWQQGWRNLHDLALLCAIAPRTVRWYLDAPIDESGVEAAAVCLGDPRLRAYLDAAIHRFLARIVQTKAG